MKKLCLIITFTVILFASCDNSNETAGNESLIFSFQRSGGWNGLKEELKITSETMYYSIDYYNPQTLELTGSRIATKTSDELWRCLTRTFNLGTFTKIPNGQCNSCVDGIDITFSVTQNDKTYSFYNGGDEHYMQMREFFDAIREQASIFNMYSSPSLGCSSFCVYKMTDNEYNNLGIAVTGNREKLGLSKMEQTFDLSKINTQDLKIEMNKFTAGSHGYYCDCVFEGELLDTWKSTSGTAKIKIVQDYEGDPSALEKTYTINVILENVVLQNNKGNTLTVEYLEFHNVTVGWFPG